MKHRAHQRLTVYAGLWLLVLLLVRAISQVGLVSPVELAMTDYWHRLAGERVSARHVALVVIDDAALDAYKEDPLVFWTPYVARAAEVLQRVGVAVIGLDLMFSISPEAWLARHGQAGVASNFDIPLRQKIASGQLVMVASATTPLTGDSQFLLPAAEFVLSVPNLELSWHIGLVDLLSDPDGLVRRFVIAPELRLPPSADPGGMPRLTFAALLAARASGTKPVDGKRLMLGGRQYGLDGQSYPIYYPGPPGHFPKVSMRALLAPDALENPSIQAMKGRVVIIGGEYAGMNDTHATPYVSGFIKGEGRYMTGPEVQASIVETLLSGRLQAPLPAGGEVVVIGSFLLVALLLFLRLRLIYAALMLPLLISVATWIAYFLFLQDILLPLAALGFGLVLLFLGVLGLRFLFEERERNRITHLFGRYVSANVVEELIASGQPPQLGGVRRTLTVLFSDIRNFTVISEQLAAEDVVEMLNNYFAKVCQVILDEGGTIDKFIGDAVMVQFGSPVAHEDHADRALRAALRMRVAASEFAGWMNERFPGRGLPDFAIGIGIHTGPVVIGNIGSEQRTEYTAIGDTVNAASRIEGMTKEMRCIVLASAETLAACHSSVVTGKSQSVLVKGKSMPIVLHEVLEVRSSDS